MQDGSQGIQSQGRLFEIGEETGIKPPQHGKGKSRMATCENCGKEFLKKYKSEPRRFCRSDCQKEFSVNRWFKCSCCHAKLGIGCKTSGKLLHVSPPNITRQWNKSGVIVMKPRTGSWKMEMGFHANGRALSDEEKIDRLSSKEYERSCMREIKVAATGFDWSFLWAKEKAKRSMRERYRNMTESEKKEWNRLSSLRNPERRKRALRDWKRKKYETDPVYRLMSGMRSRLSTMVKNANIGGYESMVGCTRAELKSHLEKQFTKRMTWDNYGSYWHVDHIMPCAAFDHTDRKQVKQCWHWTNLQPMRAKDNMMKGASIVNPQLSLMLCATH